MVSRCRERGLFLRNVGNMGTRMGEQALRVAVKDRETQGRMVGVLRSGGVRVGMKNGTA